MAALLPSYMQNRTDEPAKQQSQPGFTPSIPMLSLFVGVDMPPSQISLPKYNIWLYPTWDHDENVRRFLAVRDPSPHWLLVILRSWLFSFPPIFLPSGHRETQTGGNHCVRHPAPSSFHISAVSQGHYLGKPASRQLGDPSDCSIRLQRDGSC